MKKADLLRNITFARLTDEHAEYCIEMIGSDLLVSYSDGGFYEVKGRNSLGDIVIVKGNIYEEGDLERDIVLVRSLWPVIQFDPMLNYVVDAIRFPKGFTKFLPRIDFPLMKLMSYPDKTVKARVDRTISNCDLPFYIVAELVREVSKSTVKEYYFDKRTDTLWYMADNGINMKKLPLNNKSSLTIMSCDRNARSVVLTIKYKRVFAYYVATDKVLFELFDNGIYARASQTDVRMFVPISFMKREKVNIKKGNKISFEDGYVVITRLL